MRQKERAKATLSFDVDDGDADSGKPTKRIRRAVEGQPAEAPAPQRVPLKNPAVDTSFLPDREREDAERQMRDELRVEFLQRQDALKKEEIDVVFSYWDGSGHRYETTVRARRDATHPSA